MTTTISITFRAPGPLMSMNDRLHWSARARLARSWRHAAHIAARNTINTPSSSRGPLPLPPSTVTVVLPVRDRRRRDPHNYFATVKPVIDGLVDAGLWPDDTPEWVTTTEPALQVNAGWEGDLVSVLITPKVTP